MANVLYYGDNLDILRRCIKDGSPGLRSAGSLIVIAND